MFVLVTQSSLGNFTEFYLGKTYVHQGSIYSSLGRMSEAKNYKSRKRAELAAQALKEKVGYDFVVEDIKDFAL